MQIQYFSGLLLDDFLAVLMNLMTKEFFSMLYRILLSINELLNIVINTVIKNIQKYINGAT